MEDILASIRRIIADDDAAVPPAKAVDPPPAVQSFHYPQAGEGRAAPSPQSRPGQQSVSAAEPLPRQDEVTAEEFEASDSYAAFDKSRLDVLNLTPPMAAPATQQPENIRRMDQSEVVATHGSDDERDFRPVRADLQRPLLSSATSTAVNSAFNALAQTVLVQNARTLEDLVKEMLRPLLKTWLDDNLPGLVERLVRTEIERVSRGRS